jgi:putative spermidine/putrescine transport system permease protein
VTQLATRSAVPHQEPRTGATRTGYSRNWAWLIVPGLVLLAAGYLYPVISIFVKAFTEPRAAGESTFFDFTWLFQGSTNVQVLLRTLENAAEVSGICLLLGYPYAYVMTIVPRRWRFLMIGAVLIPFWTSATVRNYAWLILLQNHGAINYILNGVKLPTVSIIGTPAAVLVGECYVMVPFMVLPLYTVMEGINRRLLDAAGTLGASPRASFFNIYLPMSFSGVVGGVLIVFMQALGFYLTPAILGSVGSTLLPQLIVTQVETLLDFGKGGSLSLLLLGAVLVVFGLASLPARRTSLIGASGGELSLSAVDRTKAASGRWTLKIISAVIGLALVLPTLIVFPMALTSQASFQFPPPGWSLHWFKGFFTSSTWLGSLEHSFIISIVAAILATVLGTAAALGLARSRVFGRRLAFGVLIAPMVIPTVIVAIGVYLVALKLHLVSTYTGFVITYTCLGIPFVLIPVYARLQSYDDRLDLASASLGSTRWQTFKSITFPLILPGILTGALFAFVTAFDETVIALFLVGPSLQTFPVTIFEGVLDTIDPTVAAASSMLLIFTTLIFVTAGIITVRRTSRAT